MANTVERKVTGPPAGEVPSAKRALLDAARAFLPQRVPSTVTGRELAEAAGVNYGLIHHYFGDKQTVFREALLELRAAYIAEHPDGALPALVDQDEPYVLALGRSQIDYPNELGTVDDFPVVGPVLTGLLDRLRSTHPDRTDADLRVEAVARTEAVLALQLGYGLFHAMLDHAVGLKRGQRRAVRTALERIYNELALADATA